MKNDSLNQQSLTSGFYFIIGQIFIRGITFLSTPLFTRLLSVDQYGDVRIYESWLMIFVPIVTLGLYRSVEIAKYDYKEKYNHYVSNIVLLGFFLSGLFALVCFIARKYIIRILGFQDIMLVYMVLYVFAEFSIMCFNRREKQCLRYKHSILLTICTVTCGLILSLILILVGIRTSHTDALVEYRIIGYYTPIIIGGLIAAVAMCVQGHPRIEISSWKYGLKYSIPLIAELLSIQIMNQIDKIMVKSISGSSAAGIYSLATSVSYIIWVIEEAVWGAWLPWLYEKINRRQEADIAKPWYTLAHTFGIISIILILAAPEIVYLFGGSNYESAKYLIAPLVLSTLFRFYSYSFSALQNYQKKTGFVAVGTTAAMIFNVILNYIAISKYGYISAAYTTAISYFLLLVIQGFLEKKRLNAKVCVQRGF